MNQYGGRDGAPVQHADLYRIDGPEELPDMGWADLVQSDDMVLVEWAGRADGYLPRDRWEIQLQFVDDPARRRVTVRTHGSAPPVPQPLPAEDESW
jgi:tRNA A37 threonylcarbamoyladenosine biosynthesis protein TsaE